MAEMVLGLPMMILLFVGVDYFRKGYARRLDTLNQSHAAAWEKAYSNDGSCYSGAGPWSGFSNNSGDMPADEGGAGLDKKFDSSMFLYGVARSSKSASVTNSYFHATVSSNTTITCNEVVPKEDRNVLTPLIDFIKSML
jgi:hypothetical protein